MNRNQQIQVALRNIAQEEIPEHTNLWPQIAARIERGAGFALPRRLRMRQILVYALLILAVAACAYVVRRLMLDPGLQGVEDAGLITDLDLTAESTIFPTPPWQLGLYSGIAQTSNAITVTLNWAYADESRMALQLTIDGLQVPQGINLEELICDPYITSDQAVSRSLYKSQLTTMEDQPGKPIELTYVYHHDLAAGKNNPLNLDLSLTLGPCADYVNFDESYLSGPKPTPAPLIGNYHLKFQVPVLEGLLITPLQTIEANGMSMRLENIVLNPSYAIAHLCYQSLPLNETAETLNWSPEATLQIGESSPVFVASFLDQPNPSNPSETCADWVFEVFYNSQPATITLNVERLSKLPDFLASDIELAAQQELHSQGIEVEFHNTLGGFDWTVVHNSSDLEAPEVYELVIQSLTQTFEGPWLFVVEVDR